MKIHPQTTSLIETGTPLWGFAVSPAITTTSLFPSCSNSKNHGLKQTLKIYLGKHIPNAPLDTAKNEKKTQLLSAAAVPSSPLTHNSGPTPLCLYLLRTGRVSRPGENAVYILVPRWD